MPYIVVSPLSRLSQTAEAHRPGAMITLVSHTQPVERPQQISDAQSLHLTFNDITEAMEGLVAPDQHHIDALLDFAQRWDCSAPLLIHCYAGISRSTAAAYIIALALDPKLDEGALAQYLRKQSPSATPNSRMIALADARLDREGRMIEAISAIGRGADAFEGTPFVLPLSY